jgi:putative intracellular protease/amidase
VNGAKPRQIAILLYPGVTALDAVGPWEVLSRVPGAQVRFVGREVGPVDTEGCGLLLGITHELVETTAPDVVIVPGGSTTPGQMVDDEVLDWLRRVHANATWTASVCTGALILGAAGILKGQPATTHWYKMGVLRIMGAKPRRTRRAIRQDRYRSRGVSRHRSGALVGRRDRRPRASGGHPTGHRVRPASAFRCRPRYQVTKAFLQIRAGSSRG